MKTVAQMAREAIASHDVTADQFRAFAALVMEECAAMCAQHEAKRWEAYRGRGGRDQAGFAYNPYTEGESDGASKCVELIRAAAKNLK